jgi:hypothetical protein
MRTVSLGKQKENTFIFECLAVKCQLIINDCRRYQCLHDTVWTIQTNCTVGLIDKVKSLILEKTQGELLLFTWQGL